MSKLAAKHHRDAASWHEQAMAAHRKAADAYDSDKHETAAHHALIAEAAASQAEESTVEALREHADEYGAIPLPHGDDEL